jgi:hypothetical protein
MRSNKGKMVTVNPVQRQKSAGANGRRQIPINKRMKYMEAARQNISTHQA